MRVEFPLTADDRIKVAEHMYLWGRFHRAVTARNILLYGTCLAVSSAIGDWLNGRKPVDYLLHTVFAFVFGAGIAIADGLGLFRSSHLEGLRKKIKDEGPFSCVVTIDESGVESTRMDVNVHRPWSSVESVDDCEPCVEVVFRDGELLIVRFVGYEWPERKKTFIEECRRLLVEQASESPQTRS